MTMTRKTEVRTLAATDDQVMIEVSGNRRKAVEMVYSYRTIPAFPGEQAIEFVKSDGERYHVRYGADVMHCSCPGGEAHDVAERPICKHCYCVQDLVNAGFIPAPTQRNAA